MILDKVLCLLNIRKKNDFFKVFKFKKNKNSVSVHYYPISCTQLKLLYGYVIAMSTGHLNMVMVWWFLTEFCQSNFEKKIYKKNFSFCPLPPQQLYFSLKLSIWIWQINAQVKFKFGHGSMILDIVLSLVNIRKKMNFLKFFNFEKKREKNQFQFTIIPTVVHNSN
jgi:hypothetical protein